MADIIQKIRGNNNVQKSGAGKPFYISNHHEENATSVSLSSTRTFVSVRAREVAVALLIKAWVEDLFPEMAPCFVFDEDSLPGEQWLGEIERAIGSASLFVLVAGDGSLTEPWLNFEAGAAWMKGCPLLVLAYGSVRPKELPMPYRAFNAISLDGTNGIERFIGTLAKSTGRSSPTRINIEGMRTELNTVVKDLY